MFSVRRFSPKPADTLPDSFVMAGSSANNGEVVGFLTASTEIGKSECVKVRANPGKKDLEE